MSIPTTQPFTHNNNTYFWQYYCGYALQERRDVIAELQEKRRRQAEDLKTLLTSKKGSNSTLLMWLSIEVKRSPLHFNWSQR